MATEQLEQQTSGKTDKTLSMVREISKVLMLPDYSPSNPYQRELVNGLGSYGVHVILCSFNIFPILRAVWVHGKPDVLHLHWTDGYFVAGDWLKTILKTIRFFMELLIVKILGVRVVWTVHNLANHEKLNSGYEIFIHQNLIKIYDQLIVHCSAAQKSVIQLYHLLGRSVDKVNVIPHGHYVDSYPNLTSSRDARNRLGYGEDEIVFLFLGSIRPYKGIFELVDIFGRLENPKARLLIVGKPSSESDKKELLDRCSTDSRIQTRLQYVPDNEIQLYMNAANVAVFPYTDILTSGSVLLGMSFGKPIVVPRIGCISETLDAQGGFLYDPKDTAGLSHAMQNALTSDLDMMGRHNRERVEELGWNKIAKMTLDVYSKAVLN